MSKLKDVVASLRALSLSGTGTATAAERIAYKNAADMIDDAVKPSDNGDGTLTLLRDVTVPKEWLTDGRDVVAVRAPKKGEAWAYGNQFPIVSENNKPESHVSVILSDAQPKFEAGKWYRNQSGEFCGPLRRVAVRDNEWCWADGTNRVYGHSGCAWDTNCADCVGRDLVLGEVTVWQPPVSLAVGVWRWGGRVMICVDGIAIFTPEFVREVFCDWTDPPKPGRYRVPGGGKIATWEGE